ncbi:hypothetical protein WDU94_008707 [Cyamophila willieti]
MPPSCCVPTCKLTKNNFAKTSYHEIPSKEPFRATWVKQIGLLTGNEHWTPSSESAVVCSKHFVEADFVETPQRRRLKPTALPSVFFMVKGDYYIPQRRRRNHSSLSNNLLSPSEILPIDSSAKEIQNNSNSLETSKYEAFLQANFFDKNFLELLQVNLEMLEVANHFLADYSLSE